MCHADSWLPQLGAVVPCMLLHNGVGPESKHHTIEQLKIGMVEN